MVKRLINPSKSSSFFIFGARGTGKSTFVRDQFPMPGRLEIDLLDPDEEAKYSKHPMALMELIKGQAREVKWVFIDEVQKVPKLLDVVHKSIEELKVKFILSGSSARKLKRGGANLLAGRAFMYSLFPLTERELGASFHLNSILQFGSLPQLLTLVDVQDKKKYLKTYCQVYIKEEIKEEQLVRKIDPFRAFLELSAQTSGRILNYSNISRDVGVDHKTVQSYFEILADTYLGFFLPAFHQSIRKSQLLSPKFFYFDIGVKNQLSGLLDSVPAPGNSLYGDLFEHFIINEVHRLNEYCETDYRLSYLMAGDSEIDLVLTKGRSNFAVKIKSRDSIDLLEVGKLERLASDIKNIKMIYYISNCKERRLINEVHCLHWRDFLNEMFSPV